MAKKLKPNNKNRINLKLTPELGDILAYLCAVTGKSRIQILEEYLKSLMVCASAYRNFIYYVHIHGYRPNYYRVCRQFKTISGSLRNPTKEQIEDLEQRMIDDALKVEKTTSFKNCENQLTKKLMKNKVVK